MKQCYYVTVLGKDKNTKLVMNTIFAIPASSVEEAIKTASQYGEFVSVDERVDTLGPGWQ